MEKIISDLISLTQAKESKLHELLHKTKEQRIALNSDNIDRLIELIDVKQEIINSIIDLNSEFEKCFSKLSDDNEIEFAKSKMETISDNILKLIKDIRDLEMENQKELMQKIEETKNNIKTLRNERKGFVAYINNAGNSNYMDMKQ